MLLGTGMNMGSSSKADVPRAERRSECRPDRGTVSVVEKELSSSNRTAIQNV